MPPRKYDPTLERIMQRITPGRNGCWLYAGATTMGYGVIKDKGRQRKVHIIVYESVHGNVPDGLELDHLCHNNDLTCLGGTNCIHRRCFRPDHLEAVPHLINTQRGNHANRDATHCRKGHEYTPDNTYAPDDKRRFCRQCRREYMRKYRGTL